MLTLLLNEDFKTHILGAKLGSGCYRDVYVYKPDPTKVIKVATSAEGIEHNTLERNVFNKLTDTQVKYFAGIYLSSKFNTFILQDRVDPLPTTQDIHFKMLDMHDIKRSNLGMIGKRVVIIDYGLGIHTAKIVQMRLDRLDEYPVHIS